MQNHTGRQEGKKRKKTPLRGGHTVFSSWERRVNFSTDEGPQLISKYAQEDRWRENFLRLPRPVFRHLT